MSKLTEIEQALKRIDPAEFQRLCDTLLYELGYRHISPIGLVPGAAKVNRGTPDSLATLANGKFAFIEYTTQQSSVAAKILDDMSKCFDEDKTGVPPDRIQQFIACHTSILSAADEQIILEEGHRRGCIVTIFGLGAISQHLLRRFPGIAREFLAVELDTGQILTLDEFVAAYGKNALATPLDAEIRFRDDDIARALSDLESNSVLVIAGSPGVGKSRLALEIARQLSDEDSDIQPRAVLYRGLDLFRDARTYFAASGDHLVIVDDANRVSGFEHILHLLHESREDRRLRIIATVRDYALDRVLEEIRPYEVAPILTVRPLKDEQIRQILNEDFGIANYHFLERITEVAKGNPRLAVMAARIASKEQRLESLTNVSAIYDEYFSTIRQDLVELQDPALLRAAGIIAVFRYVDRKNDAQLKVIAEAFDATPEQLWAAVQRLHELELVDLYEDEVARISDQVLATYLFHLAFFSQRVLNARGFFDPSFFPQYRTRLFDALNPAASAFDGPAVTNTIRPHLRSRWAELEQAGEYSRLLELVNAFGVIEETATLRFLKERIEELPVETAELSDLPLKSAPAQEPSLWSVLGNFRGSDLPIVKMALSLALELAHRRSREASHALDLLTERFGIRHTSYFRDFEVQRAVVEALWSRLSEAAGDERLLLARLFVATALSFLRTQFRTHESKSETTIMVVTFEVNPTDGLKELRQTIWRHVGDLLKGPATRGIGLQLVRQHSSDGYQVANRELLGADALVAIPALEGLDHSSYPNCDAVQGYLQLLQQHDVALEEGLETRRANLATRFTGSRFQLAALLLDDHDDLRARAKMGWEAYQKDKENRLHDYVQDRDLDGLAEVIADCVAIRDEIQAEQVTRGEARGTGHKEWQLRQGVSTMLQTVAARDPSLFAALIEKYIASGDPLDLEPHGIVPTLIDCAGPQRAFSIIEAQEFPRRGQWISGLFAWLRDDSVTAGHLEKLYAHYEQATIFDLFRDLDFLAKYERYDSRVVQKIVAMLLRKSATEQRIGVVLADTFDSRGGIGTRLKERFGGSSEDVTLLKQAYFAADRADRHFDYNAAGFGALLDLDPQFGGEWVDWRYASAGQAHLSRHDDDRDYSDLWLRHDYQAVMRAILERVRVNQKWNDFSYAGVFVLLRNDEPQRDEIRRRQKEFFRAWIVEAANDRNQMEFVFGQVANLADVDRRELLTVFLARNADLADFSRLPLEPNSWSWMGSQVPLLERRLEFFQDLLPLFDRIELLGHREQIEERIRDLQEHIEREKKRDFLER